ncbi:MAG: Asp-tRNA(Asn)/Glu-tRNA(Gln) amidotransferase subunit GatA [Firmicutes bacterium]|jgi:aspartyl-tRNA(Asn)/glutamyl-tRNA(Gln) amidotransferase subunit A|nr:Asp-tRNA(Asn)/Glu-tRNA(Gln) amidotransferase subunit GatA [Bacillota bacterium]MCL5064479.1 Asp-tRNA(Asn)/Glu-tRNA(Gln) amidotransferase subunit GatA [Bacillota bacterium]
MAVPDYSAKGLADAVRSGQVSAESAMIGYLERIRATEPEVHALLAQDQDLALSRAQGVDRMPLDQKSHLALAGVPLVVKDNIVTKEFPTTAGSRMLEGFHSPYTATAVERAEAQGAIVLAKSNLDEFGMGSSTEHSAFGPTKNPWDLTRVPGGSSGGSAAAVAVGMAPLALGSDTGGSIRQPAAFCGIVGLKPTYGRVSRYGLIAYASSLDQIGPLARTVEDVGLLLQVISGQDVRDATSGENPVSDYLAELKRPLEGLRVGMPKEYFGQGIDPKVRSVVEKMLTRLATEGVTVIEIEMPHTRYAIATYYLIAPAEASSNLSRYDGIRYGFRAPATDLDSLYRNTRAQGMGEEVQRRILLGTHVLSAGYYDQYYVKAQKVRTLIRRDFDEAFQTVDLVVTPSAPDLPFVLGSRSDDPMQMYLSDICTVTANLAGLPALSVPAGFDDGLPIGMQWIGPAWSEDLLLRAGYMVEQMVERPRWPL